jgi:5'-3' exonuclease
VAFNFTDKLINDGNCTLIVDALNLAFRWKHQGRTDFRYDYQNTVKSLAKSYDCKRIIITADWGSSTYRKTIAPDYKQNRKDKFAEQSEEERIAFEEFFDLSSDRDWDLLIQENVGRFSYVTRKEVRLDNWKEHYEVSPEQYISLKCLTGDKGDNVPGIPGIGPKRAVQLIRDYGDAMDIYNSTPIESRYKYIQALNENAEQLLVNYELMDLMTYCDDAIGQDNIEDIGRVLDEYKN